MAGTKYERLAEYLRREFIEGKPPMSPLPSIPTLMSEQRVSQATVDRALGLLEKEGLIKRMAGVGCFAAPPVDRSPQRDPLKHEIFQSGQVSLPSLRVAVVRMPQGRNPMWEAVAGAFNDARARVEVKLVYHDCSQESTVALLDAEEPVDVLYSPPGHTAWLQQRGLLAEPPEALSQRHLPLAEYWPEWLIGAAACQIPYSFTARTVLYLEKAMQRLGADFHDGWSTTDFVDFCRQLRRAAPGGPPFLMLDDYGSYFTRQGLTPIKRDPWRVDFCGAREAQALKTLKHLYQELKAFPLCSQVGLTEVVELLSAGHPAMCIGRTPWKTRLEGMGVPSLGMWPVPLEPGGQQAAVLNFLGVYRYSRFPDLAWDFVDFVCGPIGQETIDTSLMEFPLYGTSSGQLHHPALIRGLRSSPETAAPKEQLDENLRQQFSTSVLNPEIEAYLLDEHEATECLERISRLGTTLIQNTLAHRERIAK